MGRKLKQGWHFFVCKECGRRWWMHSKNPRYGKQPCNGCASRRAENRGFDTAHCG